MLDKKPKGRLRMARDIHSKDPDAVLGREDLVGRILNYVNCEAICAVGATTKAFDRAAGHVEALSIITAERLPAHVWRRFRAVREVLFVWRPKTEHDATLAQFFDAAVLVGQAYLLLSRAVEDRAEKVEAATLSFYLNPSIGFGKQIARVIAPEKFDGRPQGDFDNQFREATLRRLRRERSEWLEGE